MHHFSSLPVDDLPPSVPGPMGASRPADPMEPEDSVPMPKDELIATQQMGNVGLLAAGLAHDLNNLLTVILGSAELAQSSLPASTAARSHLATIEQTVRRAGEMCRVMLACARTDSHQVESVDANTLVRDTVALLQTSRLAFHRLRLDLAPDLPPLQANPVQFRQVIMNLLVNAAEACGPRDGRIRISTTLVTVDARMARHLRPGRVAPGSYVRLRVTDDGCGMDASTLERLFTPFFTCKAQGRGLGLASLSAIARAHRGGVRVFSEPQRGSIFDVFIPPASAATDARQDDSPPAAVAASAPSLRGTVLLADDEDILRQSLAAFLTSQGMIVHPVADGEAALACLKAHAEIDLMLLDLMMPRITGLDVVSAVRAAGNRTPVILMTGHSDLDLVDVIGGLKPTILLEKPFSLVDLVRLIGQLVPQAQAGG